jgi:excisionase family DNA binding protein
VGKGVEWVTIGELAAELRVPVATVYQWRTRRRGPRGARFGKHVRFRRSDVDAWIAGRFDRPAA